MFTLESKVEFIRLKDKVEQFKYVFNAVHEIEITKSVDELSDTAIIKLPNRFKVVKNGDKENAVEFNENAIKKTDSNNKEYTENALQVGDKVIITLSYEGKYSGVEFVGYIKKISPKIPLEIHCEDAMWLLRRKSISQNWQKKVTLETVLQEIVKDTDIQLSYPVTGFNFEKWSIKENGAQALERLKKEFGFTSFITDDGKLHCGLEQLTNIGQIATYDLGKNIVQNNLEYKTTEERKIKVKFTYINPKTNERTIVEEGDSDGEVREYHTSVVSEEAKLKELAKTEIEKLKYNGFSGDLTGFLIPHATRGMKANILDQDHPNRKGSYFINKVVTTFGSGGARRKVSIRNRLGEIKEEK
ncbi:late control protein [Flavobacterium sp. GA093]|uniref:Late control protein n=1 Tax=Flavobacterium hydrocarbonoxydans TaxID=2683249 RepID=A0A6I4NQT0_9FLAO|nr:late control protein [Flavobacterium hydrocarbonoxydans]MWB96756.1 late control protein [Flavobacterium hydrocarbonoxydans]